MRAANNSPVFETTTSGLQFFDFNCMLGPTNTNREPSFHTAQDLLHEMDRVGIEEALVYSSLARFGHPADGNMRLLELIRDQPRLHPCWVGLPPGTDEMPEPEVFIGQMKRHGARALRLLPVAHRYPVLEESLRPLLSALAAERIPLLLDVDRVSWGEINLDWREVLHIAGSHPQLPLVLLREGGTTARVLFSVWHNYPNIHLDTSLIQESRILSHISERFGCDKMVFGTGMPFYDAGGALANVRGAALEKAKQSDIAGNNARRLLGLPSKEPQQAAAWPCGKDGFRVFDVHGHLGRWDLKYYPDWSAEQMVERMDQLGIERFAVSDTLAIGPDYSRGNDRIGKAVKQFPHRLVGYGVYNPNYEAQMEAEMTRCFEELGCSGIKLHCQLHDTATVAQSYRLAFQKGHEYSCPVLCHVHENPSSQFFKEILAEFPNCQFIFAHIGGAAAASIEPFLEVAHERPNFLFDLSLSKIPRGALAWLTRNAPVEQILFGSDHPLNGFSYQLGRVLYADIDDVTKQKILWDNAARVFGLTDHR